MLMKNKGRLKLSFQTTLLHVLLKETTPINFCV